ncbi:MAG: GTP 3',8-cyclase MoaA [Elusimicrobiota bacterium]
MGFESNSFQPPVVTTEDGFRRRVSYLRISLTDRCNLRCRYCMPKEKISFFPEDEILTNDELKRLIQVFASLGVTKIRLTGGEPLLRKGLEEVLSYIYLQGVKDVSMTTNGIFLARRLESLQEAGLKRINISLDTFRLDRFELITTSRNINKVIEGIHKSIEMGLSPVKINMVVMKGWNDDEIPDFVRFAYNHFVEVRFLELMPTKNTFEGTSLVTKDAFFPVASIRTEVEKYVQLGFEDPIAGVARTYPIKGGKGKIGFVSPVSNHFCGSCNRIRLTSTGGLKTCLHGNDVVDLKSLLRKGSSNEDISKAIRAALFIKPPEHFIRPDHFVSSSLQMSQVGG